MDQSLVDYALHVGHVGPGVLSAAAFLTRVVQAAAVALIRDNDNGRLGDCSGRMVGHS